MLIEDRHLLQELSVASYVSNDAHIVGGDEPRRNSEQQVNVDENDTVQLVAGGRLCESSTKEGPSMMVLTGPNFSGKSVYQKQVGSRCFSSISN